MSSIFDSILQLGKKTNKATNSADLEIQEGPITPELGELELKMEDSELISLKNDWKANWNGSKLKADLEKKWKDNEEYWAGKQFDDRSSVDSRPLQDNLIFESLETVLPIVTRQNPEPLVLSDNTEQGIALAFRVSKVLSFLADTLSLRLKLKKASRYWALYHLGVMKVGWSMQENEIALLAVRPQKLILDPNATIDDGEYTGEYIGEVRKDKASNLIKRFPKSKEAITAMVNGKTGTEVGYEEWWTDEYVFWTLNNEVLGKAKNPHWNYESEQTFVNEFGVESKAKVAGSNHFSVPKKPYVFLSIFNLGISPFDETGLVAQNLSVQDLVNKRLRQIDKNADLMNGGWAISGQKAGLTKEEAFKVIEAARRGGGAWIPQGNVNEAIVKLVGTGLPSDVFNQLVDTRNEIRNNFGVRGSSPQGTMNEETVRGKIIVKGQDESRSAFIAEYLEQMSDIIFNWMVQMMYVYYDEAHIASVVGQEQAREYITIKNSDLNRKLLVSVKEGSMIPKDELTKRNEAIDLWTANAIDPISLFDKLGFPNPRESAKQLFLWQNNPIALFPDLQQQAMVPQALSGQEQVAELPVQGQEAQVENPLSSVPIQ